MTPEQIKELEEKAKLWDELSPLLKTIHGSRFERPTVTTIQNTSNASSHIGLLEEEQYEWVSIGEERIKLIIPPQIEEEFNEGLCTCNLKKCKCLHI